MRNAESYSVSLDLDTPLTEQELSMAGMLQWPERAGRNAAAVPANLEAEAFSEEEESATTTAEEYRAEYSNFLRMQAVAALEQFDSWPDFVEMVLLAYVRRCQDLDSRYDGCDPNRAFYLRTKRQTAEDFMGFIRASLVEFSSAKKPVPPNTNH